MRTLSDLLALIRSALSSKDSVIAAKDAVIAAQAAEIERLKSEDAIEDANYESTIATLTDRVTSLEEKDAATQAEIDAAYDEFDGEPVEETSGDEVPGDEAPVDEAPSDETPGDEVPGDDAPVDETPEVEVEEVPAEESPSF
ncbi:metalloendopeptidase [Leptolyngbya boryana IAM M-101]|nr:metalloendopeptidase [Leptolyngbya boryana IAM M-101]BAS61689.1 metalloendopeptidase [Leptolyngbya boryana dg5]